MTASLAGLVLGLYGLLLGSFANVVVSRVPEGRSVVRPRSACPNCGHLIRARDNIPVLSWLVLKGRCRDCSAPISARYPAVELLVAGAFASLPVLTPGGYELWPAAAWLIFLGVTLSLIDIEHRRLPDVLTIPSAPVLLALLTVPALTTGDWSRWQAAGLVGVILGVAFLSVRLLCGGVGWGDVKLAPAIGVALGWGGLRMLAVGMLVTFVSAAVVSSVQLVRGVVTRRTSARVGVPLGPFLFVGVGVSAVAGGEVWDWCMRVLGAS